VVVVRNRSIEESFLIICYPPFTKRCLFIFAVNKLVVVMGIAPSGSIPDTTVLSDSDKGRR
jgi:hypothetical protein